MKKINSSWLLMSLVFAIAFFSACSKDDASTIIEPIFPDKVTINSKADDVKELSFNANQSWKLTSSKRWATFIDDGFESLDISGEAGNQIVKIGISSSGITPGETKAEIALQLGKNDKDKRVIAEILRSGFDYNLTVFDAEGNEIEVIKVGYGGYIEFSVQANFDFAATNWPKWIEFDGKTIIGSANSKVKSGAAIIKDGSIEKYPIEASEKSVITFANEDGTASYNIPVSFVGMDNDVLEISENTQWNWEVSLDGKEFIQTSMLDNTTTKEYKNAIPYTLTTLNDDYKFLYAEIGDEKYWLGDAEGNPVTWLKAVDIDKKGKIKVAVEEFTPGNWGPFERTGTIFAIPSAMYDEVANALEDGTPTGIPDSEDEEEIKNSFANKYGKYVLIEITQKDPSAPIVVKKGGYENLSVSIEGNSEITDILKYDLGIEEVYKVNVDADSYLTLAPQMSNFGEDDEGNMMGMFYAMGIDFENIDNEDIGLGIAGSENDFFYLEMSTPSVFNEPIIVVFIDGSWQNKKALVIYPN